MSEELCFLSATTLRERIARRELSPVEVTRAVLERAERLQPVLNCFITLCGDEAMAQARSAEKAVMRGDALGLLHGVPFTCKDLVNTRGVRTTFGSLLFEHNVPTRDAEAIARLRRQGAILVGKTTTSEFGAKCLTDAPLFGRTRNAWSAAHTSGGSSGGAAVAVAAGIAPIGIATDGGGSTRIPASCNGVVGLKQSNGIVPHSQVEDVFGNLTYVTPMTRDVADTALMLEAMAGEDASDPWSIGVPVPDYRKAVKLDGDLRGKRVLFSAAPEGRIVSAEVGAAFEASLAHLRELGAELIEMPPTNFNIEPLWRTINHTVWRARFTEMAEACPERLSPSLLQQLALASAVSGADYQRAMFARTQLFRRVQALLRDNDFLAMPTLSRTALPIDQDLFGTIDIDGRIFPEVRANWFPWTMPFNLTGHPAISLPSGFGQGGLPIGIQLAGRFRREPELLRAASLLEAAQGLLSRRPDLG
ncbi:amidase [Variovorax sp. PBL-E5]|uniref:amidase n=1 Tax=Variovorax sp. PBL-E5 TaxID=434014 RepID=UPI00131898E0|nr:amidase [Variovorax sp. PBL-E5]VTU45833.1 Glutamyl-tRNA(Gln) amidotransferase subunit A [Variovorax sp. PBL-E5]